MMRTLEKIKAFFKRDEVATKVEAKPNPPGVLKKKSLKPRDRKKLKR